MERLTRPLPRLRPTARGFSLVELLAVMVIMSLLIGLTSPAINSLTRGSNLTRAGQLMEGQVILARQEAVARQVPVELRLYETDGAYRIVQVFRHEGTAVTPVTRPTELPTGIRVVGDDTYSPLLDDQFSTTGNGVVGGMGNLPYRAITFRASGGLGTFATSFPWLTLVNDRDVSTLATANVYVVQVDPLSGSPQAYQP